MNSRLLNSSKEMAKPMVTVEQISKRRHILEKSLTHFLSPIPHTFWNEYLRFQKGRQFRFLFQINVLALFAYLFFGVADYYVLPDIGWLSLITRFLSVVLFTGVLIGFF